METMYINKILSKLKDIFKDDKYTDFIKLLKEGVNNIGITGSFLLGNIDGSGYFNDIDICATSEFEKKIVTFCLNNNIEMETLEKTHRSHDIREGTRKKDYKKNYINNNIKDIHNIHLPYDTDNCISPHEIKIQFIIVNNGIQKYIDTFDLSICKNLFYYDYNSYHYEGQFKLNIEDPGGIGRKTMTILQISIE
jgi:hypothetical protein